MRDDGGAEKKEDQPVVFPVVDTKRKRALLKKLRLQLATKVKLRWIDGDDAQKEKATSGVAATLVALEREFGVKRDGEEVGKCVEDAETLATKTKKKKKKRKIDDGGGFDDAEEAEKRRTRRKTRIQTTTTTTRGSMFDDDKRAMDAFHRLAKGILAEEEEGDSRVRDGTELGRSAKDVASRVHRFDSFRACSAQWSLATISAALEKMKKKNINVENNDGLREALSNLRERLARRFTELADTADARACATNIWFLARTRRMESVSSGESASSASLKAAMKGLWMCEEAKISSQDGANALWGMAKMRAKSVLESEENESVVAKLAERVAAANSSSNSGSHTNSKEISSAMWAVATMHVDGIILVGSTRASSEKLDAGVFRVAKVIKKAFQKEKESSRKTSWSGSRVIANCAWSCSKLFPNTLLAENTRKVLRETIEIALESESLWHALEPRAFATLLSAASAVRASSSRCLLKRALDCFEDTATHGRNVTPADACDLCEFIEATTIDGNDETKLEESDTDRAMKIVTDISKTCDWRASGRLLSSTEALKIDARAKKRLISSGVEAIRIMELNRFNVDEATVETLSRHIEEQLKSKSTKQRRVLIANCESRSEDKLRQTVEKFGHRFETWQRFASNDTSNAKINAMNNTIARPWPSVSERKCDYAFVRACPDKEALLLLTTAVATRVKVGGDVFVSGSRSEGFLNAFDAFKKNVYEPPRRVSGNTPITHSPDSEEAKNDENDFAFAITAKVLSNGDEKTASLDAFKKVDSNVKLFGSTIEAKKWTTYPGFFAKGGLDIMTSFLLDSIFEEDKSSSALKEDVYGDTKKPPKRVMDFCCGSGIIGYALRHSIGGKEKEKRTKKKKVKLTVLDADAVSLEAAKQNLRDSDDVTFLLSDGFPLTPLKKPCELILTNPPVHYNSKPDFRVLGQMFRRLSNVLKTSSTKKAGGVCFCVCQRYVPFESVARFFIHAHEKRVLDVTVHAKNDRFVVWKIKVVTSSSS